MNTDQIAGLVRAILSAIGGFAVGKGLIDASTMTTIVGAITTIIVSGWSIWANKSSNLVAAVSKMDAVDSTKFAAAIADPDLKQAAKTA